jgi:hypothetical protein
VGTLQRSIPAGQPSCVTEQPACAFSDRGVRILGHNGHGISAQVCDPGRFADVISVKPGVLERGAVLVDLIEPGGAPNPLHRETYDIVREEVYKDCSPWVVVALGVPRPYR